MEQILNAKNLAKKTELAKVKLQFKTEERREQLKIALCKLAVEFANEFQPILKKELYAAAQALKHELELHVYSHNDIRKDCECVLDLVEKCARKFAVCCFCQRRHKIGGCSGQEIENQIKSAKYAFLTNLAEEIKQFFVCCGVYAYYGGIRISWKREIDENVHDQVSGKTNTSYKGFTM